MVSRSRIGYLESFQQALGEGGCPGWLVPGPGVIGAGGWCLECENSIKKVVGVCALVCLVCN